jgi:hypothetical protein
MATRKETNPDKSQVTISGVWKVASFLVGYLIMGVWITAQISEANKSMRGDIQEMKTSIHHLTVRLDSHIDSHIHNERNKDSDDK